MTTKGTVFPPWFVNLVLGVIGTLALCVGGYGVNRAAEYEKKVDAVQVRQATNDATIVALDLAVRNVDAKIDRLDGKFESKLDRVEAKIDRVLERK